MALAEPWEDRELDPPEPRTPLEHLLHENHRLTWTAMNLADDIEKQLRPAFEPRGTSFWPQQTNAVPRLGRCGIGGLRARPVAPPAPRGANARSKGAVSS
jgi:hypothetical protein